MGSARINSAKLRRQLETMSQQASGRAADKMRERVRTEIVQSGRINTGRMFTDIDLVPSPNFENSKGRWKVVFRADYFRYQDQGTAPTVVAKGKVMRFKPSGAMTFIFRTKNKGVTAGNFVRRARDKMLPSDYT